MAVLFDGMPMIRYFSVGYIAFTNTQWIVSLTGFLIRHCDVRILMGICGDEKVLKTITLLFLEEKCDYRQRGFLNV